MLRFNIEIVTDDMGLAQDIEHCLNHTDEVQWHDFMSSMDRDPETDKPMYTVLIANLTKQGLDYIYDRYAHVIND